MAIERTQGTSSSSMSRCAYDVFLSFRGEDTRTTFTDHLCTNLVNEGIHTFRDDDELERGENIQSELQKAIKESRISVIVFSKGYASSRWCLDELVEFNERRKTSGHRVLPLFYHADPSDVRKQTGSFQEAFAEHKRRFNEEKLKGWKAALKEVAELAGKELKNGCLLTIDDYNKVTVHQLLQDMGREIVLQESPDEPGERSRLWRHKDALQVLEEKSGTKKIQGLIFNLEASQEEKYAKTFLSVNNANRCHSEEFCYNSALYSKGNSFKRRRLGPFSWFRTIFSLGESSSASNRVHLKTDAFSPMHKLRILHLNNVQLIGGYQLFPKKLGWLRWHGFSLKSIPNEFFLESLVVLEMRYSCLEEVWKGSKFLWSLKILDLSHSHVLVKTPDFSNAPNLVNLSFEDCINLIELHESIVELRRLVLLNLEGCKNLRKLPINFGQLKSVEELVLTGCSKLCEIPTDLRKMESLKVLKADRIAINALPFTTAEVSSWRSLFGSWVSKPREIPNSNRFSLALPRSLTILHLQECDLSHDAIPKDIGSLSSLRDLNLSGNPILFPTREHRRS